MRFICSVLAILLALFSFSAQAAASLPSDPTPIRNTPSPPPSSLQQLQWAGIRLQTTLGMLQEQSEQLQLTLSALHQQMLEAQLKQALAMKTENMAQLVALRMEYHQAQNALLALRQEEALLQARMKVLNQRLTQLPYLPLPPTAATQPKSASATHTPTKKKSSTTLTSAHQKTTRASWIEDPIWILRVSGGCTALILIFLFFWSRKKKSARKTAALLSLRKRASPKENMTFYMESATPEENADLTPEYDFMSTQEAIPTRLNLARGYIEMGKLLEAREAIKPVFEHGNALQKQEATQLLEKIEQVDMHV